MEYELVITRTQPPCGGKSPRTHEFRDVSIDDVIGYIRSCERELPPGVPLEVRDDGRGTLSVEFKSGASTVTYEFTES